MVFSILALSASYSSGQSDSKLIYVGDPMCSWCYGFTDELSATIEIMAGEDVTTEFVMGGLRPYYNVPMTEMKDFLSSHWKDVHNATGQVFTYDILDREDLVYDTEPPCRAVVVMRSLAKGKTATFFKNVQHAFYYQNKDLSQASGYYNLLKGTGISPEAFKRAFDSDEMKGAVKEDFAQAGKLGVSSFPTLLLQKDGEAQIIAQGYAKHEVLISKIRQALSK